MRHNHLRKMFFFKQHSTENYFSFKNEKLFLRFSSIKVVKQIYMLFIYMLFMVFGGKQIKHVIFLIRNQRSCGLKKIEIDIEKVHTLSLPKHSTM